MSRLNDLLRQLRAKDPALAADLEREVGVIAGRRAFGLNFERHVPEVVELPGRRVRRGDKVHVLPPRGSTSAGDGQRWRVRSIDRGPTPPVATLDSLDGVQSRTVAVPDLVVVAEFRDPIYPGLVSTGRIERGGDAPFHTVINAENYHALQTLLFTHRGQVDCIYIDPPYNTGARDWKYNNHYVESDDLYRHSKWLAFMERRLILTKELLNPDRSVLLVAIDEKEYLRLGLLLEQVFPDAQVQMISTVINRKGVARGRELARVNEFIFAVFIGKASVVPVKRETLGLSVGIEKERLPDIWNPVMRRGTDAKRTDREGCFYPVFVDEGQKRIHSIGRALGAGVQRSSIVPPPGTTVTWPIRRDGSEGRWQVGPERLGSLVSEGYARLGTKNRTTGMWTVNYLIAKDIARLAAGELLSSGLGDDGAHVLAYADMASRERIPKTVWNIGSHDATEHGSNLLRAIIPGRQFPFPKSLYAVEDALSFFVGDQPQATVLDFFAGSGTTAHAVMRLNRKDGGRRRSISITNNEVSADEQAELRLRKLRPGDPQWEARGIFEYITRPRVCAAATGQDPEGNPLKGEYKFNDQFSLDDGLAANVEFFTMTYEAPLRVATNNEFTRIAPVLWLQAGSRGLRIDDISKGWDVADAYGVIADFDHSEQFVSALADRPDATHAFVVTDEDWLFESMCRTLPDHVEPVRLYQAYLRNFEIESARGAR
ncbi:MAG: site-specific DNA-methyltransferase [Actinomycetia bacterium]|nr:site-specific DNA-methyltransferase [Actinomycetes bacterium]